MRTSERPRGKGSSINMKIRHLNIEVTKRCNQRCFYCFNNSGVGSAASELTLDRWLSLLHSLQHRGLESIHLTGGEPFIYKSAIGLLAGAQAMGLSTSILSNGFRVKELAGAFPGVFRRLTVAQISLDSMNEEKHNARRGYPRAWQDAVAAIRCLRELAVPVEVSCVVSQSNVSDLHAIADFCQTMDAGLIIRPMLAAGRAAAPRTSEAFIGNMQLSSQSLALKGDVRLVSDRFYYVANEREMRPSQWPADVQTAHYDGRLRFSDSNEINLAALAA